MLFEVLTFSYYETLLASLCVHPGPCSPCIKDCIEFIIVVMSQPQKHLHMTVHSASLASQNHAEVLKSTHPTLSVFC